MSRLCQSTAQIFIAIFMAAVCLGCRDRNRPPDFDRSRTTLTMEALENIEGGRPQEALDTLGELTLRHPSDPFPPAAKRTEEIKLLVAKANSMLTQGNINDLSIFLQQTEKDGDTSPELLAFRSAPPALEALAQYCSRMPWEHSSDIIAGEGILRPHLQILNTSEAFKTFFNYQQQTYETMLQNEWRLANMAMLSALDKTVISGNSSSSQTLVNQFRKRFPANPYFLCQEASSPEEVANLGKQMRNKYSGQEAFEIAMAQRWRTLSKEARANVIAEIRDSSPHTLSGEWLLGTCSHSFDAIIAFLLKCRAQQPPLAPSIEILSSCMKKTPEHHTPCPGAMDIMNLINQIKE